MTQDNEQDGQPRDMANLPSEVLPSPPEIHDKNDQSTPPTTASPPIYTPSDAGDMIILSPQPPPISQTEDTTALPQRPRDHDVNPRIASLRAMFPDFDDSLLSSVLQSVNDNQDLAIDTLLGMSDPDYVSLQPQPQEQHVPTQTDLDEQLARRLTFEEEQAAHQWRPSQQDQGHQSYQPRRTTSRGGYGAPGSGGDEGARYDNTVQGGNPQRDTMADLQDGFNKIAETGKKTFTSIFSKVKAKMQEFDQGQGPSRQDTQPTWGQSSTNTSSQLQPSYHEPNLQRQQSYYDPNPPGESRSRASGAQSPPRPNKRNSVLNTNIATKPIPNSIPNASNPPTFASARSMSTSPPPEFPRRSGDLSRPTSAGAGTPSVIDPAKLGLLPKRPVSLLREHASPPRSESRKDSSDDELEYAENPFEDNSR